MDNSRLQISNEQIVAAARAGAELLSSDAVSVPSSRMGELLVLRQVLVGIGSGQLVVGMPAPEQAAADPEPVPSSDPPRRPRARR